MELSTLAKLVVFMVLPSTIVSRNDTIIGKPDCSLAAYRDSLDKNVTITTDNPLWNCTSSCTKGFSLFMRYGYSPGIIEIKQVRVGVLDLDPSDNTCWGYNITLTRKDGSVVFSEIPEKVNLEKTIDMEYGEIYTIHACILPRCYPVAKKTYPMPADECEAKVWQYSADYFLKEREKTKICYGPLQKESKSRHIAQTYCKACKKFNGTIFESMAEFSLDDCQIKPLNTTICESDETNNKKLRWLISISAAAGVLFIAVLLVTIHYCKRKQTMYRFSGPRMSTSSCDSMVKDDNLDSSLMILHCPGCDVLDKLVADFAFILRSYKFVVMSALLDQTSVDAEGGIASYMQRNMKNCRYILIVLTEQVKALDRPIHRPFKFALTTLSGQVYNDNNKSVLIPVYFNKYMDLVKFLPTFLYPSIKNGFQIPNDLKKLVKTLTNNTDVSSLSEVDMTDKIDIYVNKLKEQANELLNSDHKDCSCKMKEEKEYDGSVLKFSEVSSTIQDIDYGRTDGLSTIQDIEYGRTDGLSEYNYPNYLYENQALTQTML